MVCGCYLDFHCTDCGEHSTGLIMRMYLFVGCFSIVWLHTNVFGYHKVIPVGTMEPHRFWAQQISMHNVRLRKLECCKWMWHIVDRTCATCIISFDAGLWARSAAGANEIWFDLFVFASSDTSFMGSCAMPITQAIMPLRNSPFDSNNNISGSGLAHMCGVIKSIQCNLQQFQSPKHFVSTICLVWRSFFFSRFTKHQKSLHFEFIWNSVHRSTFDALDFNFR